MAELAENLTPDELVSRWGNAISKGTLANWRSDNKGPPYRKLGGRVVYPVRMLEQWEAKNMVDTASNDNGDAK